MTLKYLVQFIIKSMTFQKLPWILRGQQMVIRTYAMLLLLNIRRVKKCKAWQVYQQHRWQLGRGKWSIKMWLKIRSCCHLLSRKEYVTRVLTSAVCSPLVSDKSSVVQGCACVCWGSPSVWQRVFPLTLENKDVCLSVYTVCGWYEALSTLKTICPDSTCQWRWKEGLKQIGRRRRDAWCNANSEVTLEFDLLQWTEPSQCRVGK